MLVVLVLRWTVSGCVDVIAECAVEGEGSVSKKRKNLGSSEGRGEGRGEGGRGGGGGGRGEERGEGKANKSSIAEIRKAEVNPECESEPKQLGEGVGETAAWLSDGPIAR